MSQIPVYKRSMWPNLRVGQKVIFKNGAVAVVTTWQSGPKQGQKAFKIVKGPGGIVRKKSDAKRILKSYYKNSPLGLERDLQINAAKKYKLGSPGTVNWRNAVNLSDISGVDVGRRKSRRGRGMRGGGNGNGGCPFTAAKKEAVEEEVIPGQSAGSYYPYIS